MKAVIEQSIRIEIKNPRFAFIRSELNRCGVKINVLRSPMSPNDVGEISIMPQVLTADFEVFECVVEIIKRFYASGQASISLERESYLYYVLKTS